MPVTPKDQLVVEGILKISRNSAEAGILLPHSLTERRAEQGLSIILKCKKHNQQLLNVTVPLILNMPVPMQAEACIFSSD